MALLARYWAWLTERPETAVGDPGWVIFLLRFFVGGIVAVMAFLAIGILLALGPLVIAVPIAVIAVTSAGRLVIK